jgi:dolichyl-diphosphooligosaccharide--protein glycosyltransferase
MDLHFLIFLFPAGVILCFRQLRDEHVFVIIYALVASYFAGVMVRLMLTLTPIVCVSAAVALSSVFDTYIDPMEPEVSGGDKADASKKDKSSATPASGASVAELLTEMVTSAPPPQRKPSPRNEGSLGSTRALLLS